ncbi:hypothetical protein MVEN_01566500 [Mycena venus]|uniref:Uncharacterized protein n=1 Tax=Mycena venus TaxID=2733690 RepID=A0A8H6XRX9_9AGAR|nr:hypothetical protein MVEN_01566500 [Mycena venus]
MGRWTQYDEDSTRLPEGMKRIGYDADTARYTFRDREGSIYMGPAHEHYGLLTLVRKNSNLKGSTELDDRPHAFASDDSPSKPGLSVDVPAYQGTTFHAGAPFQDGATFHDLLPSHLIASPSSAESTLTGSSSPASGEPTAGARFRDAVRRTALPAMQNAVNTVRRSATSVRKPRSRPEKLARANSSGTTRTVSVGEKGGKY